MILRLNYDENYDFEEKQLGKYAWYCFKTMILKTLFTF